MAGDTFRFRRESHVRLHCGVVVMLEPAASTPTSQRAYQTALLPRLLLHQWQLMPVGRGSAAVITLLPPSSWMGTC